MEFYKNITVAFEKDGRSASVEVLGNIDPDSKEEGVGLRFKSTENGKDPQENAIGLSFEAAEALLEALGDYLGSKLV